MSHNEKQLIAAEKNVAFLAEVAKGDHLSWNAQAEEAKAKKAAQKFPFQGCTFVPSHTFQPQLATSIWTRSSEPW